MVRCNNKSLIQTIRKSEWRLWSSAAKLLELARGNPGSPTASLWLFGQFGQFGPASRELGFFLLGACESGITENMIRYEYQAAPEGTRIANKAFASGAIMANRAR